jgi:hypothetical protein
LKFGEKQVQPQNQTASYVNRIGGMIAMAIPGSTTASEEKHPARKPADNYCDRVSLPFLKMINDNSLKI